MKKTLLAIACGLVMALTAATAQAAPLTTTRLYVPRHCEPSGAQLT